MKRRIYLIYSYLTNPANNLENGREGKGRANFPSCSSTVQGIGREAAVAQVPVMSTNRNAYNIDV